MGGRSEFDARDGRSGAGVARTLARRWRHAAAMPPAARDDAECDDDEPVEFEPDPALLARLRARQH